MANIYPVTIPKWGIEMQEGTITAWHFEVGQAVEKGQELLDIESDKIVNAMEAPASGVLKRIVAEVDETLKVGQLLGVIAAPDTSEEELDAYIAGFVPADAGFGIDEDDPGGAADTSGGDAAAQSAKAPVPDEPRASGPGEAKVSPVARRLAEKLGVDIGTVRGTGRGGRISTADVEAAAARGSSESNQPPPQASPAEAQALSGRALAAARRMVESKQTIPHFYLQRDLDMRHVLDAKANAGVPLTALVIQAMAAAMQARPQLNAHFVDNAVHAQETVSINVAVDTQEGLVAPLLADIGDTTSKDIAARLAQLAGQARARKLGGADLAPGGMTLSNLGMFGITAFTAIINPPQVAILAVGSIRPAKLEVDAEAVPAMTATLSCDHRAIDGAEGARFLAALQEALDAL